MVSIVQAGSTQDASDPDVASFVVEAARGDHESFTRLYDLFAQRVYNMILRSVRDPGAAEDVAQEVWTKVHRELRTLREPRCFPAWLYRIAAKKCIDASRSRARRPQVAALTDDVTAMNASPEDSAIAHEDEARIWAALAGLTPNQHMALYLREVEQRTYREIAYVLRMSETAVGLCIFRARRSLLSSYDHLRDAPLDACKSTQRVMSLSIDGRATPVQQHALDLHIDRCSPCRTEFSEVRTAAHAYAGLALAPTPFLLNEHMLGAATAAKATAGSFGKLLAWLAPNVKVVVVAGSIAATAGLTTVVAAPMAAQLVRDDAVRHDTPLESQPHADVIAFGASSDCAAVGIAAGPSYLRHSPNADDATLTASSSAPGAPDVAVSTEQHPDASIEDRSANLDSTLDNTLSAVEPTLDEALTIVDETIDSALTAVDETLPAVDETLNDVDQTLDETMADVDQTLDDVTEPILGPPAPELETTPEPGEDSSVLEPAEDLLPPLP